MADTAAPAALDFRSIADSLREEVMRYYRSRGEDLSGRAGDRTLETNSSLVESRGGLLLHILARAGGPRSVAGLRVVDLVTGVSVIAVFTLIARTLGRFRGPRRPSGGRAGVLPQGPVAQSSRRGSAAAQRGSRSTVRQR